MKNQVIELLNGIIKTLGSNKNVELTPSKGHGDFSTNIAMQLSKELQDNPQNIANKIVAEIKTDFIEKAEVAGPGFINIFLKNDAISSVVETILKENENFGKGTQDNYINIEYVSANPTGYLHVGHARGAAVGSSLVNLLKFAGNKVDSEYYINDAGNQIDILGLASFTRYQQELGVSIEMPEDTYRGQDIVDVAKLLVSKFGDQYKNKQYSEVESIFKNESKAILLEKIKEHLKQFNVEIDLYSSEAKIYEDNKIDVTLSKLENHTYKNDGAVWLKTMDKGDDKDRVLIKGDGKYTYLTPDIAYHDIKLSRGYNQLINIWGADHAGYIKRMQVALEYLGLKHENLDILTIQLVKLMKDGQELKMSKRAGTAFTLHELIEEVGVDAARWFMLDRSVNTDFVFDVDVAKKQSSENPVFTVQYTHARANQLINKSTAKAVPGEYNDKEKELINTLSKFPDVIDKAATNHKVHYLTQYLSDLVGEFNSWYTNTKMIGSDNEASQLALVTAVKIVMSNTLNILGIKAPEKM